MESSTEISQNKEQRIRKNKKVWTIVIIFILLIGCAIAGAYFYSQNQKKEAAEKQKQAYANDFIETVFLIEQNGEITDDTIYKYLDVWQSAIFEDSYMIDDEYYDLEWNEDWSDAIMKLSESLEFTTTSLEDSVSKVEKNVTKLSDPPENYEDAYDTLIELYKIFKSYSNLAIEPSGSLQSYTDSTTKLSSEYTQLLDEIMVRIPNDQYTKKAKEKVNFDN